MRGLAYNRKKSFAKAKRKQNICKKCYGWEYYNNLHQYSKNKIHCSCSSCRITTAKRSWCGGHRKGKNWKHSDLKKINRMEWDDKNWYKEEDDFIIPREDTFEDWWILFNIRLEEMLISKEGN